MKEVLIVPISFVTEHIETLHEINIEARAHAKKFGIETFRMMPAVGDSPVFIQLLRDLVLNAIGSDRDVPLKSGSRAERASISPASVPKN